MCEIRSKVSNVGYVNRIRDNLLGLRRKKLLPLYEHLKSANCVVCGGSGRSLCSLNAAMSQIAMSQIGWRNKVVLTPDDPGFPGKNMYDAAAELERRYKRILLLINSGSGVSEDPKAMAEDLARYIEDKKTSRFSMGLVTSNVNTPLAKIVRENGHVVELKGRGKSKPSLEYSEIGIMGDMFELGSLLLLCMMTEAISRNLQVDGMFQLCEEEFAKLGPIIDSNVESETYNQLIDMLERRTNVFLGGKGTANEIVKMAGIRLFHIKGFLGDNVYTARGVNTPHPRAGDLEILVSFSGETRPVINWCETFKKLNGIVLSITGTKKSTLAEKSDLQITLEETVKLGQPRRFYMRAAYVLSPLPVKLTERLSERGLKLPEYMINWYHSVTQ
ncbi:MAG: SIS domain-containing protein [Candidatus Bathyarchaeota archaeon]|nr:SIS domain-containing protein [Candidatus Bathyarchaeota archaeon]MDH5712427.1 SIS domain-containing protein [Candidatus Bathyarchaeota archaeon]